MPPRVLHSEIDKLVLMHEAKVAYPLRRPEARLALAQNMGELGLATRNGSIGYGPQLLHCSDFTVGFKHSYGKMQTTAMLRTKALHFHFAAAYRRMREAVARLPWVDCEPQLGGLHICADVEGQQIGPDEMSAFDDQTRMRIDTQGTLKDGNGRPVQGGVSYEWKRGGETLLTAYDKKAELRYNTRKSSYMRPLYLSKGWDGRAPLTRIEIRPTREQIKAAYSENGDLDLTMLWRTSLEGLRFTEGDASVPAEERPTAPWWQELIDLEFSLRTANPPLAPEKQRRTLETELAQADGSIVSFLAKKLVLHAAHPHLLPPLSPAEIEMMIATAECIRTRFPATLRKRALSMGVSKEQVRLAGWPEKLVCEVFEGTAHAPPVWSARDGRTATTL